MEGYRSLFYTHIHQTRRLLLGWYSDRLLAERAVAGAPVRDELAGDWRAKTFLMGSHENPGRVASFFQWEEVPGVAMMDTDTFFIREADRETVRIVVTSSIVHHDDRKSRIQLYPVEVRLRLKTGSVVS